MRGGRFDLELSTKMPGVYLRVRGRFRFRRASGCNLTSTRSARAAALRQIGCSAAQIIGQCGPDERFNASHRLCLEYANWRHADDHGGLLIRAKFHVTLDGADAERAAALEDARRARYLEHLVADDRIEYLRRAYADPVKARLFWLSEHPEGIHAVPDWDRFDAVVEPLIERLGGKEDPAARTAAVITGAIRRLKDDPGAQKRFLFLAVMVFEKMGWHELAAASRAADSQDAADGADLERAPSSEALN